LQNESRSSYQERIFGSRIKKKVEDTKSKAKKERKVEFAGIKTEDVGEIEEFEGEQLLRRRE